MAMIPALPPGGRLREDLDQVIDVLHNAKPADPASPCSWLGAEMATRKERLQQGVPIPMT